MKILWISWASRKQWTYFMLKTVLDSMNQEYEIIHLKDKKIDFCINCKRCMKSFKCANENDDMKYIYEKLSQAEIIVLWSPTYFENVSWIMKNFIDRCLPYYFSWELKNKKIWIVSIAWFKEWIEYDKKWNCIWCTKYDNACKKSVLNCIRTINSFCNLLQMNIIWTVYSIHWDTKPEIEKLKQLWIKLINKI